MIVGITGKKSSGKDTIAEYLIEQYDFRKLSFAALLKQSAAALFDIDPKAWEVYKNNPCCIISLVEEEGGEDELIVAEFTAREFLQRYGTEAHRQVFGDYFWIEQMWKDVDDSFETRGWAGGNFVIPDTRFGNEAQSVVDRDGFIWRVNRPGQDGADQHASEDLTQTDPFVTIELQNDGGFEQLYNAVDEALTTLYGF